MFEFAPCQVCSSLAEYVESGCLVCLIRTMDSFSGEQKYDNSKVELSKLIETFNIRQRQGQDEMAERYDNSSRHHDQKCDGWNLKILMQKSERQMQMTCNKLHMCHHNYIQEMECHQLPNINIKTRIRASFLPLLQIVQAFNVFCLIVYKS